MGRFGLPLLQMQSVMPVAKAQSVEAEKRLEALKIARTNIGFYELSNTPESQIILRWLHEFVRRMIWGEIPVEEHLYARDWEPYLYSNGVISIRGPHPKNPNVSKEYTAPFQLE